MRICSKCTLPKEETEFFKNKSATVSGLDGACKVCRMGRDKIWKKENPEKVREIQKRCRYKNSEKHKKARKKWADRNPTYQRDHALKIKYGITKEDFNKMLEDQSGKCKICEVPLSPVHVDHCHKTNKVRGLLCQYCNGGLGMFKDSPKFLISAARYLKMARYLK